LALFEIRCESITNWLAAATSFTLALACCLSLATCSVRKSRREFEFLEFLQAQTGHSHGFGDIMVSGPGLSFLHEFLTGRRLAPQEVAREIGPDSETTRWFARFFGRACRSYALNVLSWGGVSLCGGIAARNPFLATHGEFLREFTDCPAYASLLAQVPIRLITAPDAGLHGAASHAASIAAGS